MQGPKLQLQEGLDKLIELDPVTWGEIDYEIGISTINWGNFGHPDSSEDDIRDEKRILRAMQGVIQDAIMKQYRDDENQQWIYNIKGSTTRSGPRYSATVSIFTLEPDDEITETRHESHGPTPAEAILLAFVASLEASK